VSAPPIADSFVVNIGDLLQRWSNDLYHSNAHRVLNAGSAPRYSLPFFQDGDQAAVVACLPSCCSDERPARYAPCTIGDYLEMKVNRPSGRWRPELPDDTSKPHFGEGDRVGAPAGPLRTMAFAVQAEGATSCW
jgi:hypothetical protein